MTVPAKGILPRITVHSRHSPQPRGRLVCLPHAGAPGTFFSSWAWALPAHLELLTAHYSHCQGTEPLAGLADEIAQGLAALPRRPTALFGHSMGAVVAYEVARRLENLEDMPLLRLFVSGARSPGEHRPSDLHLRGDDELIAMLRALGGTAPEILDDPVLRAVWMPDIRRDFRILDTYRHSEGPPLRCPVTAMVGRDDPEAPVGSVRRWREYTGSSFELCTFPGGHFYLADGKEAVITELVRRLSPGALSSDRESMP